MSNSRVAIYCRIARADEDIITAQEEKLLALAEKLCYNGCVCYRDNGESGSSFDRPGMRKLQDDIREWKIHTVIVCNLSRVARGGLLLDEWFEFLQKHEVSFISLHDNIMLDGNGNPLAGIVLS